MKLIISALLAAVLCLVRVQAVAQDFDSKINSIFQNVDKSQVPTGFLRDYGFEFLNPDNYTGGLLHDSNYVGLQDWRLLYATLLSCQVNTHASPTSLSDVNNRINTYNYGNMPLTFVSLDFDYNRLKADALSSNLMYVSNDQLFDVSGRPASPYETASMFAIAPTHQQVLQGNNQIIFRPELFYSNNGKTVSDIAYNIGGGSSYTSIGFNTAASVTFSNTGWYVMNIRVTYTDNTVRYGHTKVLVFSDPAYGQSNARFGPIGGGTRLPVQTITATEQYQGVAATVQMNIQLSVNNTTGAIRRPLIVVEGFDPRNDFGVNDFTGSLNVGASGFPNTLNRQLDDIESYDLIFVNYANGTDYIQRNALAVEAVIKWVNANKTVFNGVRQGNVIIGQSMGGLVTRWALRDMELDGVAHETRLFISHDAPHWGANVPASAQLSVQYLHSWHVINFGGNFPFISYTDMFPRINESMGMFTSPAARQMLIKRYVLNGNSYSEENSLHDAFMNELNGMGWPVNSRNILVSNGACTGAKAFGDNSNLVTLGGTSGDLSWLQIIGTGFLSSVFGSLYSTGVLTGYGNPQFNSWNLIMDFPLSLITTKKTYTLDFRLNAVPSTGAGELFRAQIYNDKKILWVINARSYILNKSYSSFSGMLPLDNAPGGQFNILDNVDITQITAGLPGFLDFIKPGINQSFFCFVPTVSALAFNDPLSYLTASFCNNVPCLQTSSVADYFAPTANEAHIQFTSDNSGWLLQRQNPTFTCAKVCPTGLSITGSTPVCTSSIFTLNSVPSGATVNWTTDAQWLGLTPAGAAVTVTRPADGNGEFTLTAQVSNACNSVPAITSTTYQAGTPGLFGAPSFSNAVGGMGYFCSSHYGNTMELPDIQGITYKYRIKSYPSFNVVYTNPQTYSGGVITIPFTPQAGWYIVEIQVINQCGGLDWDGYEVEYVDCNEGGNPEGMRVQVSPNPASSDLYLTLDDRRLAQTEKIECTLYSILGSKIAKRWVLSAGQSRYQLNLGGVLPGQYVLVFNQGNKRIVKKIMIK